MELSYHVRASLNTELTLVSLLKVHRNQIVITALAVLLVFLCGANASYASSSKANHGLKYHTQLGQDLDGDHIPETATIRECGHLYQVSIHFTTGRPKLHLKTYVTEDIAGLSFQTTDINNDNKGDLVIISATSLRPIAVWLNQGRAKFKKVNSSLYGAVGRYYGPVYRVPKPSQPEPVGNLSFNPFPQATLECKSFNVAGDGTRISSVQPDQRPFESALRQVPSRGPPTTACV